MLNFEIINRTIQTPPDLVDVVVQGDTNSKTILFTINRYFDGVDLSEKTIQVAFMNKNGDSEYELCHLLEIGFDKITFSWVILSEVTTIAGQVQISVEFSSTNEEGKKDYIWRTKPKAFNIESAFAVLGNASSQNYELQQEFYLNNVGSNMSNMIDSEKPIEIVNRRILITQTDDLVVAGDTKSQIITFSMPRYIDNVDYSLKCIAIKYTNAKNESDRCHASNIIASDTTIKFGWIIDGKVAVKDGYVYFAVECFGYDENGEFTYWQTLPALLKVTKGLTIDGSTEEPIPSWLEWWHSEKEQLISQISSGSINNNNASNETTYSSSKIESLLSDLTNPLTATFSISPSVAELGSTINSVALTWNYNKNVSLQSINETTIESSLRSYNYTAPLTSSKTFVLTASSTNGNSISKTANLNFYNGIYYGKSTSIVYNSSLIQSLTKVISDSKSRTISVIANSGEFIYYCIPSRFGTVVFTVGGFVGGFSKVSTISYSNANGYVENYDIYRSDNADLGNTTVVIS